MDYLWLHASVKWLESHMQSHTYIHVRHVFNHLLGGRIFQGSQWHLKTWSTSPLCSQALRHTLKATSEALRASQSIAARQCHVARTSWEHASNSNNQKLTRIPKPFRHELLTRATSFSAQESWVLLELSFWEERLAKWASKAYAKLVCLIAPSVIGCKWIVMGVHHLANKLQ